MALTLSLRARRAIWLGLVAAWVVPDVAWRVSITGEGALPAPFFHRAVSALTFQLGEGSGLWLPVATVLVLTSRRLLDRRLWSAGLALVAAFCVHELHPAVELRGLQASFARTDGFEIPPQALTSTRLLVEGGHGPLLTHRLVASLQAALLLLPAFLAPRRSCPPAWWPLGLAIALAMLQMLAFRLTLPNPEWSRLVPGVAGFLALTWGARNAAWSDEAPASPGVSPAR
jgi:hypothetical protein